MRTVTILFLVLACLLQAGNAAAATISARTDRNQVSLNESFQIIFEAEGDLDGDPDFSPLEQDFQVLSTVQSSNFSVLNGRISSSKRWTLTVMANDAGVQTIPAIAFGGDKSPEIQVDVKEVNNPVTGNRQQDDIFLEASASPLDPYVQAQVIYTLKLYRSVAIAKASLADPEVTTGNAVLERIDDDKSYETTINGRDYQVIERNYAMYPQSSGEVTIAPINFMGQISRSRYGLDPFGAPPRTVVRRSEPVTINVRGVPPAYDGNHWLPAENVTLAEEWSGDPMTLRVGEPITRILILTAKGLISSQLPELPSWGVTDLKFYPDRPQMEDIKSGDGITSNRREKAAIIPNQPGSYVLPEVSVSWWNTVTDRLEHAVVPEHTIQVLPATGTANTPAGVPSMVPAPPARPSPVQEKAENTPGKEPSPPVAQDLNIWKWTTLLLITVWLVTLLMWRAQTGKKGAVTRDKSSHAGTDRPAQLVRNVLAACDRNDPVRTKTGLMDWSKAVWPGDPPQGIGDIAARTGPGLAPELIRLNQALYSRQSHGWDGRELKRQFSREAGNFTPQRNGGGPDEGRLEPLFRIN